jgi:hypothetical protein
MHSIRLRGPWQLEPIERYVRRQDGAPDGAPDGALADPPAGGRATMPADWSGTLGGSFQGVVRYRRTFQKPTGLESGETVWLVVEPPRSCAAVSLADRPLGEVRCGGPPGRFDITQLLEDHNRLEIVVTHPTPDSLGEPESDDAHLCGGLVGEVRLEIEEPGAGSQEPGS